MYPISGLQSTKARSTKRSNAASSTLLLLAPPRRMLVLLLQQAPCLASSVRGGSVVDGNDEGAEGKDDAVGGALEEGV